MTMSIEDLLDMESEFGPLKSLRLISDHYLVQKIKMGEHSEGATGKPIILPDTFRRRSVGNMALIKGLVVRASGPFRSKHRKARIIGVDADTGLSQYKYIFEPGQIVDPAVLVGDGILYNSYNVGQMHIVGLDEPLVFVRGIDIEAVFSMQICDQIQLGEHALRQPSAHESLC